MTSPTEFSLQLVLDEAVTAGLNALGAGRDLAPLRWTLAPMQVSTQLGPTSYLRPHVMVGGEADAGGGDPAGVARAWAGLLGLTQVTGGPAGQLMFAGHLGEIVVRVSAVVDPDAFRAYTERRDADRQAWVAGSGGEPASRTEPGQASGK